MTENIIRVSVSEAARLFGVSSKTIRDAIKKQDLRYIVVSERYKINFESLVQWSQRNRKRQQKLENTGIGQFVDKWKMKSTKYSPQSPRPMLNEEEQPGS